MQTRPLLPSRSLAEIRSQVCDTTLVWLAILAAPALSLNIYRVVVSGWRPVVAVYAAVSLIVGVCAIARRRLPFSLKANVIVGLLFANAIAANSSFGSPAGLQHFVGAAVMAAVLFGRRAGVLSVVAALAAIFTTFWAFRLGFLSLPATPPVVSGASWLTNAGGVIITSVGPIVAISALISQLSAELERAAAVDAAKTRFVATISHELRTPMTAILGFADMLLTKSLSPDISKSLARISASARWLVVLLDDLLDFSKLERERVRIENIPFSLNEALEEVVELCAPLATKKGITLTLSRHGGNHDAFLGDPTRLRQVIFNLVGNAIKFTERGAVDVRVSALETGGEQGGEKTTLSIGISDTGIGMSSEQMDLLFQPFTQGDATITRRFGGTGLGLAISKRLVELMGGQLSASSTEGKGSCFTFSLSLAHASANQLAASPEQEKIPAPPQPLNILFADDTSALRELVKQALSMRGHTVDSFSDGDQAVAAFEGKNYDAVLLDLHMPVMNGIDAAAAIRKQNGGDSVMIVAVTADVTVGESLVRPAGPFDRIIWKPINWGALFRLLERRESAENWKDEANAMREAQQNGPSRASLIPLVDPSFLRNLVNGLPESSVASILNGLDVQSDELLNQLVEALSAGHTSRASEIAHSLKGLFSQFGAVRAAEIAREIEFSPPREPARALELASIARESIASIRSIEPRG